MLLPRLALGLTAAVALVTVTACGGSSGGSTKAAGAASSIASAISSAVSAASTESTPTAAPATSASSTGSSDPSATDSSSSDSPSFINGGDALADSGNLVYVLEAVNPKIGSDKNDLIAKSKALCTRVNANESEGQLETDAAKGFTNGTWVPSESEAQAIVGTVKAYAGC